MYVIVIIRIDYILNGFWRVSLIIFSLKSVK